MINLYLFIFSLYVNTYCHPWYFWYYLCGSVSLFRQEKELKVRPLFLLKGLEQRVQLQDWWSSPTVTVWYIGLKVPSQASEATPINVRHTEIP